MHNLARIPQDIWKVIEITNMAGTSNQTPVKTISDQCLESVSEPEVIDTKHTATSLQTIISLIEGPRSDVKQIRNPKE